MHFSTTVWAFDATFDFNFVMRLHRICGFSKLNISVRVLIYAKSVIFLWRMRWNRRLHHKCPLSEVKKSKTFGESFEFPKNRLNQDLPSNFKLLAFRSQSRIKHIKPFRQHFHMRNNYLFLFSKLLIRILFTVCH